jgi:anti-sigma28 factor (negative regulator of flagellin synthesis)
MRDTTRHISNRRPPKAAPRVALPAHASHQVTVASSDRIDALRRVVAAGQYRVNARALAGRILQAAGMPQIAE